MTAPVNYRFSDQCARLEAIRTYLRAAADIATDALDYERRAASPSYVQKGLSAIMMASYEAISATEELQTAMQTDIAIENGKQDTLMPPPPTGAMRVEFADRERQLRSKMETIDDVFADMMEI